MMDKLLPCPFCGGEAIPCSSGNHFATEKFFVSCGVCGVETPRIARTRKEAIAAWNRRAQHMPTVDTVEVVRCRDCVHFGECLVTENDFCSYGERKENY